MELIDLGLPSGTKWASCNISANKPTEYGDYFAWGDTSTKSNYVGRTCETYDLDIYSLKMEDYVNGRNVLSDNYDAAAYILGERWRIPSGEQAQELIDYCQWEWVNNYEGSGVNGMVGISKINGAKVFLPASGYAQSGNHLIIIRKTKCFGKIKRSVPFRKTKCSFFGFPPYNEKRLRLLWDVSV